MKKFLGPALSILLVAVALASCVRIFEYEPGDKPVNGEKDTPSSGTDSEGSGNEKTENENPSANPGNASEDAPAVLENFSYTY